MDDDDREHCHLYVSDLERSERFSVDAFGPEVVARIDSPDVREVVVGSPNGGSQLMLAKRASPDRPVRPDGGIWKLFLCTDDAAGLQPQAIVG